MDAVDRLLIGKDLTLPESRHTFRFLLSSRCKQSEFGKALLVLLQKKGEHTNELAGLIQSVRTAEKPIRIQGLRYLVDGCGTGGDQKHTFNISTVACLVAASAGAQVAKHGNRCISSRCGSSDVAEALGINIHAPATKMIQILKRRGFGYFHAPKYHPIFRYVQPIRMALGKKGIKTIFNLTGPLVNPLRPRRQVIGVSQTDAANLIASVLHKMGMRHALVIRNARGYDELTTLSKSLWLDVSPRGIRKKMFSPSSFGFARGSAKSLQGGNAHRNRSIALNILKGKDKSTRYDTVLLNAAAILFISGKAKNVGEGIRLARRAIRSQAAWNLLKKAAKDSHDS